jgi:hypothetical protein
VQTCRARGQADCRTGQLWELNAGVVLSDSQNRRLWLSDSGFAQCIQSAGGERSTTRTVSEDQLRRGRSSKFKPSCA